jgi:hypothetical protein
MSWLVKILSCTQFCHTPADEFDVFMDAVNRRISMKMMVRHLPYLHPSHSDEFPDGHCGAIGQETVHFNHSTGHGQHPDQALCQSEPNARPRTRTGNSRLRQWL